MRSLPFHRTRYLCLVWVPLFDLTCCHLQGPAGGIFAWTGVDTEVRSGALSSPTVGGCCGILTMTRDTSWGCRPTVPLLMVLSVTPFSPALLSDAWLAGTSGHSHHCVGIILDGLSPVWKSPVLVVPTQVFLWSKTC